MGESRNRPGIGMGGGRFMNGIGPGGGGQFRQQPSGPYTVGPEPYNHNGPRMSGPTPINGPAGHLPTPTPINGRQAMPGSQPAFAGGMFDNMSPYQQAAMMFRSNPPQDYSMAMRGGQMDPQRRRILDEWFMRNPDNSHAG